MPIKKVIKGNLLDAKEDYICQQCNCVTVRSHGLSKSIADRYPYADIYSQRTQIGQRNACTENSRPIPGTIKISKGNPNVLHMFGQYFPGKPGKYSKYYSNLRNYHDDSQQRQKWFQQCLKKLDELEIDNVAMPYQIGCGLAGGSWRAYEKMLQNAKTDIFLYQLY